MDEFWIVIREALVAELGDEYWVRPNYKYYDENHRGVQEIVSLMVCRVDLLGGVDVRVGLDERGRLEISRCALRAIYDVELLVDLGDPMAIQIAAAAIRRKL